MNHSISYHLNQPTKSLFFYFKSSLLKVNVILFKNNYTHFYNKIINLEPNYQLKN